MMMKRKNKSTTSTSSPQNNTTSSSTTPSESDDAFAAAAAAAAAAASAADVATLSGWGNESGVGVNVSTGGGGGGGAAPANNTQVRSSTRSIENISGGVVGGGGDSEPDAISHSARLALSNSIRHHANLLRDAEDQTIQGFDDNGGNNANTNVVANVPTIPEDCEVQDEEGGGGGIFDSIARRVRGAQTTTTTQGGEEEVPAYAAGSNNSLLSHRSKTSTTSSNPNNNNNLPYTSLMTSSSSLQSSSIQSTQSTVRSSSSPATLYTLVPKALLFRAILAILSLGVALALAIFHGGGRLGLEVSSIMFEKTLLDGVTYVTTEPKVKGGGELDNAHGEGESATTTMIVTDTTLNIPQLQEMNIELPPSIDLNFAELASSPEEEEEGKVQYVPNDGVPLFWMIPSSGSNVMKHVLGKCFGVIEASEVGAGHDEVDLQVFETNEGQRYVNVDTTTYSGLTRATSPTINLASSGLSNLVIFSPLLHPSSLIFTPQYTAKFFALFRHPVDRVISHYHHLQKVDYSIQDMSITEYAQSGRVENNYITRTLLNKHGGGLTQQDVYDAMEILRRKCVVGLVDHIEESFDRFESVFGWNVLVDTVPGVKECRDHHLVSTVSHDFKVEEGSEAWNIIMMHNERDYEVYKYAQFLFWNRDYVD